MGTHPIFESDFDCLTERVLDRVTIIVGFHHHGGSSDGPDAPVVGIQRGAGLDLLGAVASHKIQNAGHHRQGY